VPPLVHLRQELQSYEEILLVWAQLDQAFLRGRVLSHESHREVRNITYVSPSSYLFHREIECLKRVELLKQQLVSRFDYSILSIFRLIDRYSHGKINADNLRIFLARHNCA